MTIGTRCCKSDTSVVDYHPDERNTLLHNNVLITVKEKVTPFSRNFLIRILDAGYIYLHIIDYSTKEWGLMRFDIKEYNGEFCMHCPTREKAHIFLKYLDSVGVRWCSGYNYLEKDNYEHHGADTCYFFNKGMYGKLKYAVDERYTILEFDDFEWCAEEPYELKIEKESAEALDTFFSAIKII